jgi:hypothetical protein
MAACCARFRGEASEYPQGAVGTPPHPALMAIPLSLSDHFRETVRERYRTLYVDMFRTE